MPIPKVLIVGGGIAGLCCARHLHLSGIQSKVLESADEVGGLRITKIGRCVAGSGVRLRRGQHLSTLDPRGFDHFVKQ